MRSVALIAGALGLILGLVSCLVLGPTVLGSDGAQAADSGPVIVIPGRHGLPVLLNGVDVAGAVVEGDFGLYSPHMVNPVVIAAPFPVPPRYYPGGYDRLRPDEGTYFPALGHAPGYGRREVVPPADRPLPPPAQGFHRSWSSRSEPLPASLDPPAPPLIVAPQIYPGDPRRR